MPKASDAHQESQERSESSDTLKAEEQDQKENSKVVGAANAEQQEGQPEQQEQQEADSESQQFLFLQNMIDQSLVASKMQQSSETSTFSGDSPSQQAAENPGEEERKDESKSAAKGEGIPPRPPPTSLEAKASMASISSFPTLWTSEAAFNKSVDSFIQRFKSTDSFGAFAALQGMDLKDSPQSAEQALRDFLVSQSVQKDGMLSQVWREEYEGGHQDVDPGAVFSQQSVGAAATATAPPPSSQLNQVPSLSQDSVLSVGNIAWMKEMYDKSDTKSGRGTRNEAQNSANAGAVEEAAPALASQDSTFSIGSFPYNLASVSSVGGGLPSAVHLPNWPVPLPPPPLRPGVAVAATSLGTATNSVEAAAAIASLEHQYDEYERYDKMVAAKALIESAAGLSHASSGGANSKLGNGVVAEGTGRKRKRQAAGKRNGGGRLGDASVAQQKAAGSDGGRAYYVPTDLDVLCGRGGKTNHHPGNKFYLQEKDRIQPRYMAASKTDKTVISQELVDIIRVRGGRFLEQEDGHEGRWFEISDLKARKKASQTLREINTPEERKAKRERYAK